MRGARGPMDGEEQDLESVNSVLSDRLFTENVSRGVDPFLGPPTRILDAIK